MYGSECTQLMLYVCTRTYCVDVMRVCRLVAPFVAPFLWLLLWLLLGLLEPDACCSSSTAWVLNLPESETLRITPDYNNIIAPSEREFELHCVSSTEGGPT